jgi:outer membrane receptor for Fe3+-dicitrate
MSAMAIFFWQLLVMAHWQPQHNSLQIRVVCNNTLAIALRGQQGNAGVVKVPHSTQFDAEKVKQQLGISVRAWDEHMYEMKQLSQRKVTQQEAALTLMRCLTTPA